jgi:NADH-quinone oxidoreductase subunit G
VVVGPSLGSLAELAWRRVGTAPGAEAAALADLAEGDGEVAEALRAADAPVVLVGERGGRGTLTAATRLAEAAGGKVAWVPRRAGARGALEAGLAAGLLPGGRRLDDAEDRAALEAEWGELPEEPGGDLEQILTAAAAGKIDVLHLIGVDLARDCDDPELAVKALKKVGTVVAQDLALNDTVAEHADVVLPATGTQERAGSTTNWEGRTQRFSQAIAGHQLVLDDWEIVQQLSALLGHDLGFNDLEGLRREIARVGVRPAPHAWPQLAAEAAGEVEEAGEGEELALVSYPLLLDGGTMLAGADDLNATAKSPWAGVNAHDAERLGVADGALVEVAVGKRKVRLPARVGHDVVPGAVFVPAGASTTDGARLGGLPADTTVTLSVVEDAEVGA